MSLKSLRFDACLTGLLPSGMFVRKRIGSNAYGRMRLHPPMTNYGATRKGPHKDGAMGKCFGVTI
jgi:hypothetical protein